MKRSKPIDRINEIIGACLPNVIPDGEYIFDALNELGIIIAPMTFKEDPNTGKLIQDGRKWE